MRHLFLLFGVLALFATAEVAPQNFHFQTGNSGILDLMRAIGHAQKAGDEKLAAELKEKLSKARDTPIGDGYDWESACETSAYLEAEIFAMRDPSTAPKPIAWAMDYLDRFWTKDDGSDFPYPGDFDKFMHEDGFRVIRIDYDELPEGVKKWREEEIAKGTEERKFVAVKDNVAFFAPGVVKWLLPLFAGKNVKLGEDACLDELVDLSNYHKSEKVIPDDVKYIFDYGGRSQIGSTLRVKLIAEKRIRKDKQKGKKTAQGNPIKIDITNEDLQKDAERLKDEL